MFQNLSIDTLQKTVFANRPFFTGRGGGRSVYGRRQQVEIVGLSVSVGVSDSSSVPQGKNVL